MLEPPASWLLIIFDATFCIQVITHLSEWTLVSLHLKLEIYFQANGILSQMQPAEILPLPQQPVNKENRVIDQLGANNPQNSLFKIFFRNTAPCVQWKHHLTKNSAYKPYTLLFYRGKSQIYFEMTAHLQLCFEKVQCRPFHFTNGDEFRSL